MRTSSLLPLASVLAIAFFAFVAWRGQRDPGPASDPPSVPHAGLPYAKDEVEASRSGPESTAPRPDSDSIQSPSSRESPSPEVRLDPSFVYVRSTLADAIELHLPSHVLSETELDALADASLRLRSAQQALRVIPEDREHSTERARARRRLEESIEDFTYVLEMSPAEFSRRVQSESGIDDVTLDDADIEVLIRPLARGDGRE